MKYLVKLNALSVLYALVLFFVIEIPINSYRISRITGLHLSNGGTRFFILKLVLFILLSFGFVWITNRYLSEKKIMYLTTILWLPYLLLFFYLFASWFPMTEPADKPAPVTGLIAMGAMMAYPFYILMINLIARLNFKSDAG